MLSICQKRASAPAANVRGARGFTLVEMMVVIAALIVVSVAAARYYSKGRRGEQSAAFARVIPAVFENARQISMTPGTTSRLRLMPPSVPGDAYSIITEKREAGTAVSWRPVSRLVSPRDLLFCRPVIASSPGVLSTVSCPLGAEEQLVFSNGQVRYADAGGNTICPTGSNPICPGISFPFKTPDDAKKWNIYLFGLTGMARMIDRWD